MAETITLADGITTISFERLQARPEVPSFSDNDYLPIVQGGSPLYRVSVQALTHRVKGLIGELTGAVTSVNGHVGDVSLTAVGVGAVPLTVLDQADGVAVLGSDRKIAENRLPDSAFTPLHATGVPLPLGNADRGTSSQAARSDHTHQMPTPAELGVPVLVSTGAPADLAVSASRGTSATAARSDHAHKLPTPADIGAPTSAEVATALAGKSDTGHGHSSATSSAAGFMTGADRVKLDGIAAGATNTPLSSSGAPAALGTAARGTSTDAARADHVHNMPAKADIGLGNVDNTSDANKPVSSAQAAAIALKIDKSVVNAAIGGLTVNADTSPARLANKAILQAAFDAIPSGCSGVLTLKDDFSGGASNIYVDESTGAPDQGTRKVIFRTGPDQLVYGGWPFIARHETYRGGCLITIAASSDRTRTDLPNRGDAISLRSIAYVDETSSGRTIAERRDLVQTVSLAGQSGMHVKVGWVQKNNQTDNGAYWQEWDYVKTPLGHDLGVTASPGGEVLNTVAQSGAYIMRESNIANQIRDPGYHRTIGAYNPATITGISGVPEHGTTVTIGGVSTRVGFHCSCVVYAGPNGDLAGVSHNGVVPKHYSVVLADPNSVAPDGAFLVFNGNSRSTSIGNGGTNNQADDPGYIFDGQYYVKRGLNFTDMVFSAAEQPAMMLREGQNITARATGGSTDVRVFGTNGGSTFISAASAAGRVYICGPDGNRAAISANSSNTSADSFAEFTAGVGKVAIAPEGASSADLEIGGKGTGKVVATTLIREKNYIVSGLPSASSNPYCRAFVTDGSVVAAGNFGAVVSGGGANVVPVYSDGTNWRIG